MKIEHLAIWAHDIELLRTFYTKYFDFTCGALYENKKKGFTSYFLSPGEDTTRVELMHVAEVEGGQRQGKPFVGYAHIAISVGGKDKVNALTELLRSDGYTILSEPRTTGDGNYESAIADPEGNYVEITA